MIFALFSNILCNYVFAQIYHFCWFSLAKAEKGTLFKIEHSRNAQRDSLWSFRHFSQSSRRSNYSHWQTLTALHALLHVEPCVLEGLYNKYPFKKENFRSDFTLMCNYFCKSTEETDKCRNQGIGYHQRPHLLGKTIENLVLDRQF